MYRKTKFFLASLALLLGLSAVIQLSSSAPLTFDVPWFTLDGGGGQISSNNGRLTVTGTIGQADAGPMTDGKFSVHGGFWHVATAPETSIPGCSLPTEPPPQSPMPQLPYAMYLPIIIGGNGGPDLVVDCIYAAGDQVEVVIKNPGAARVTDEFWVDLYINPSPVPTGVNQTWDMLSDEGLVWGIDSSALPLEPGEAMLLTLGDTYFDASRSNYSNEVTVGSTIYVQVDSANTNTTYGGVLEQHEINNEAYNNIDFIQVSDTKPLLLDAFEGTAEFRSLDNNNSLPPR